jgi:hypothetical protein
METEYVPHLLKNTRNALIDCAIEFSNKKHAKFEHIQAAFNLDQQIRTIAGKKSGTSNFCQF